MLRIYLFIFFLENHFFYEIMLKNIAEPGRPQMTIGRMRIVHWIPKAKTHSQNFLYLLLFTATTVAGTRLNVML